MDFPLESIHKKAFKAHVAANCALEQGKYWEMHEILFTTKELAPDNLTQHAKTLGLNIEEFETCVSSDKYPLEIRNDIAQGLKAGGRGTPAFYLGLTVPDSSTFKATRYISGAQPYENFVRVIEGLLQEVKKKNEQVLKP